ncbi:hypothetical protein JCM19992_17880 [Thermostilla marina]
MEAEHSDKPTHLSRRRRVVWGCLVTVAVMATAGVFHASLLRWLVAPLVADPPAPDGVAVIWLRSDNGTSPNGDGAVDAAAALWQKNPAAEIIITQAFSSRLVQIGVVPSLETTLRRELMRRGVPGGQVVFLESRPGGLWYETESVCSYLHSRQRDGTEAPAQVVLIGEEFAGRAATLQLQRAIGAVSKARRDGETALPFEFAVWGVRDRRFSPADWWKSRDGVKACMFGWLNLIYSWLQRGPPPEIHRLAPEDFKDIYMRRFGRAEG